MSPIEIFAVYIRMMSFWHNMKGLVTQSLRLASRLESLINIKKFRESYLKELVFLFSFFVVKCCIHKRSKPAL
jgi:hypothetical protein